MPDRSMGGGSYNSGYGSASKSTSSRTTSSSSARSSTTQAAAAARAAASRAASTAATRSSGAGASLGSFSSGAAVNARTGTSNSAASRNMSSGGGYGASRPASANVNAAAARAAMSANQRSAGITQSAPGKGNLYGANQVVSKGVNLSAGDYLRAGYGEYKNPTARVAMAARPNTTVAKKGVNLSAGDLLSGGYGQYRQAPSAQSTPQTAANGWSDLAGIQRVLSQSAPTVASIVAGDPRQRYSIGGYQGEISDYATRDIMGQDAIGNTLSAALSRAEIKKDITDRVPSKAQPTAVAGYQNPARAFPARNVSAPVQVASYQNPARAFPARPQPQESNYMPKTALPASLYANLQKPPSVGRAPVTVADVPHLPFQDVKKGINLSPADMLAGGYGSYQQAPAFGDSMPAGNMTASLQSPMAGQSATFRSPASAAQYNAAMGGLLSAANQVAGVSPASSVASSYTGNGLYDGDSTPTQKVAGWAETKFEKIANPAKKAGEWLNGLLGGSGYNDLYGRSGMTNPNARDPLNTEADKFRQPGESDAITSEQINSLSAPQKAEFDRLVASGMSRTEAYYRALGYTAPTTQQPKTIAYPEYYSKWAGLPTGTYA